MKPLKLVLYLQIKRIVCAIQPACLTDGVAKSDVHPSKKNGFHVETLFMFGHLESLQS